jgi:hypothetical protein
LKNIKGPTLIYIATPIKVPTLIYITTPIKVPTLIYIATPIKGPTLIYITTPIKAFTPFSKRIQFIYQLKKLKFLYYKTCISSYTVI